LSSWAMVLMCCSFIGSFLLVVGVVPRPAAGSRPTMGSCDGTRRIGGERIPVKGEGRCAGMIKLSARKCEKSGCGWLTLVYIKGFSGGFSKIV